MRIALLISGGGTTMEAIIRATQRGELKNVEPVLVIASKLDAGGLEKAKNLGMNMSDLIVMPPKDFSNSEAFGEAILVECKKRNVEFIGQYGWLAKTPDNVISAYKDMIVNQHPGPLDTGRPDFGGVGMYGMRVHEARLEFVNATKRDYWSEATTHRVTSNFDEGVVLHAIQVPIVDGDTAETLQARMLPVEHQVQIETLRKFAEGNVQTFIREIPLVNPEEIELLEKCKAAAIAKYPKG